MKNLIKQIIDMSYRSKEGHIPSALSILDILWVLYDRIMTPDDKFVLSKGHGCLALYVVLAEKGVISSEELDTFGKYDSALGGHPDMNKINGVEASTGSLGHGFPMAVGMALGKRIKGDNGRVYCLIGDGECNEGSIWEAAMLASHHKLNNLTCIVDHNGSAERGLGVGDLLAKFKAFGWYGDDVNGHDYNRLEGWIAKKSVNKPTIVVAHTIKGKGVKMMENNPEWHHKSPSWSELKQIAKEL